MTFRKKPGYSLTILLLAVAVGASVASAADPGDILWKYQTGGQVHSSPALGADGTIYVGSDDSRLHAINPDGTPKWTYAAGDIIFSSPAVGADGTIYVGSNDKNLHAINPDGSLKWTYATGGAIMSSPAIGADGVIYVGSADYALHAIRPDKSFKWKYQTGSVVDSSPAIGIDNTLYVGSRDGCLYAIDLDAITAGTRLKWKYPIESGSAVTYSSPAIGSDGTIYIGCTDGFLYAIDSDGNFKWDYETGISIESSPAIGADGTIYVGSWDKNLYAINPDGTPDWDYLACDETGYGILSSPAIGAGRTIYVGSTDKRVYAMRHDRSLKWKSEPALGGAILSSPAISAEGDIYIGSEDGYLYAIKGDFPWQYGSYAAPTEGYAASHWPKFRQNNLNLGRRSAFELRFPEESMQSYSGETASIPVTLMNLNEEGIQKVYAVITYDKDLIEITDIILAGGILEGKGYLPDKTIDSENGKLIFTITAATEPYVTEEGTIAAIQYHGITESGLGNLNFTTTKVNDLFMSARDGAVEIAPRYDISGNIAYFTNQGPVRDVTLTLADENGDTYDTKKTDADGNYAFPDIPPGNYTLTPSKASDLEGLSSLDASRILQYALGKIQPDCYQMMAADADRSGAIDETGEDASKTAECSGQRDLGLECQMNAGADNEDISWIFMADPIETCENWPAISYSSVRTISLDSDKTEQNFIAVLLGDVTGNWPDKNQESIKRGIITKEIQPESDIEASQGDSLTIPVILEPGTDHPEIEGIDIVVQFDPNGLDMTGVTLIDGPLADWESHLQLIRKEDEGLAAIRIYGSDKVTISENENIAFINFNATGSTSALSLKKFELNEADASGGFGANGIVAAQVNVTIYKGYDIGDIDHSESVDLHDALLALKVLAGMSVEPPIYTDTTVNKDEKIMIADVIHILQVIAK